MTQEQPQASPLERRIDMSVTLADIDREVEQRLRQISRTAKMPGFRPGKVPMKLVAQQHAGQARSEAIGSAVERAFGEKIREQNLRIAGYPRIEPLPAADASVLQFSAVFEVYPEITLGDVAAQAIDKPRFELTDAEVDKTLDVLRKQRTTYEPADRAAQQGDRLVIDFLGRKDGVEFEGGKATDYAVLVGAGSMLPDFEAAMVGVTAGQSKTFTVVFPADYHAADLAGQTVEFDMTVKSVEAPKLPEIDADFARGLGIKDGDIVKMREEVQSNLQREVKKRLQQRIKNQVMDALLNSTPFDVPQALVEMESQQMADAALKDLQQRGMLAKNVPVEPAWFTDQALRRVRLGLIMAEVVRSRDLHAKPEQIRSIVDDYAETFEDPQEVVRWYYSQPQRLADAEALAMENNVVEWVLAQAKVTEQDIAFDELMGNQA
jgi:trigger factor